jgi:hypothetical protein
MTTTEARDLGSAARPRAKTLGVGHGRAPARVEPALRVLLLDADDGEAPGAGILEREFPTVLVLRAERREPGDLVIDDFAWRGAFDVGRFDEAMMASPLPRLVVRGGDAPGVAVEVLGRYQRLVARRNAASTTALFDVVLDAHARLFQARGAAALRDHEHALDTWQWMQRLEPDAGLVPQLAALFHDVERLDDEPIERIEHRARRLLDGAPRVMPGSGADRVRATLRGAGVAQGDVDRVADLVCGRSLYEREAALLDDADAVSFLSLTSAAYADYFGLAQTRRKVTFLLNRLGHSARSKVALIRLRPDVHRLLRPG